MLRLSARADRQATEEKKLRILMRGVMSDISGGLVCDAQTTLSGFIAGATSIERALAARASYFHRLANVATSSTVAPCIDLNVDGIDNIRDVIREVVR